MPVIALRRLRSRAADASGAASVEFVAMLPVVVALALGGWQALVAAQAAWLSGGAAGAAARAAAVGGDPAHAARGALPGRLHRGLRVRVRDGVVTVRVRVPTVTGKAELGSFAARAHLREQS